MSIRQSIRRLLISIPYAKPVDLSGKHIIVTGSLLGSLGYETAKQLARWGATVIVTSLRNTNEMVDALKTELAKDNIQAKIDGHDLDLSDSVSVNQLSQWYVGLYGDRLDCLINNAGVHLDLMSKWKEPTLTADGFEIHWRINYLGTVHLSNKFLPLLRATGQKFGEARVVTVVSQLHSRGSNELLFDANRTYGSWQAYGLSKLALIHFTHELERRFSQTNHLKSYCLHPGSPSGSYTNIADKGFEGHAIVGFLRKIGAPIERFFMTTSEEGAQTSIHCATSAEAKGGNYYLNCQIAEASVDTKDEGAANRLWQETGEWLGKVQAE